MNGRRGELVETWTAVVEAYGPNVSGRQVREVVRARREELKAPEERLPERLGNLHAQLRSLSYSADFASDWADSLDDAPAGFVALWLRRVDEVSTVLARLRKQLEAAALVATEAERLAALPVGEPARGSLAWGASARCVAEPDGQPSSSG